MINCHQDKYGVFQLYSGEDPQVEYVQSIPVMTIERTDQARSIVAVHGLNGDPYKTWTTKSGTCWLSNPDFLPKAVKNLRILTFGYNANATSFMGSTSSDRILQHAQTLVAQLEADRAVGSPNFPLQNC